MPLFGCRLILLATGVVVFAIVFDGGHCQTDSIFMIDKTGGDGNDTNFWENFKASKLVLMDAIGKISTDVYGNHVGVIEFGSKAEVILTLGSLPEDALSKVKNIEFEPNSIANFDTALQLADRELSQVSTRKKRSSVSGRQVTCTRNKAATLLTSSSGHCNQQAIATAGGMSAAGINLVAVGIGERNVSLQAFLQNITSNPSHVILSWEYTSNQQPNKEGPGIDAVLFPENLPYSYLLKHPDALHELTDDIIGDIFDTAAAIVCTTVPSLSKTAKIIIGALSVALLIIIIIVVACCLRKKKSRNPGKPSVTIVDVSHYGRANPAFMRQSLPGITYGYRYNNY